MVGDGLLPKASLRILPVAILIIIFSQGLYLLDSFCMNMEMVKTLHNTEGQTCISLYRQYPELHRLENERLVWQRGYKSWTQGQSELAIRQWQQAPHYTATMLATRFQNGNFLSHSEAIHMLQMALYLDPQSTQISETASFYFLNEQAWTEAYMAFTSIYQQGHSNAVVKAALAVVSVFYNPDGYNSLALFDEALAEAPGNTYVLRYGFRLMQRLPDFDLERTRHLATLGEMQLPQDFEFTFGLANAYRRLGDYATAEFYNLIALKRGPEHPWANLQQVELLQLQNKHQLAGPWLDKAMKNRVTSRSDYYRRLIAVLLEADETNSAYSVFCDGLSHGMSLDGLIFYLVDDSKEFFRSLSCVTPE